MKPAPALLLGLLAPTAAALNVNRRMRSKAPLHRCAQIALPTASLAQVALPAVAANRRNSRYQRWASAPGRGATACSGAQSTCGNQPVRQADLEVFTIPAASTQRKVASRRRSLALYSPERLISAQATTRRGRMEPGNIFSFVANEAYWEQATVDRRVADTHWEGCRHVLSTSPIFKVTVASKFAALTWRTSRDDGSCALGKRHQKARVEKSSRAGALSDTLVCEGRTKPTGTGSATATTRALVKAVGASTTGTPPGVEKAGRIPACGNLTNQIHIYAGGG